jgi:hypothetical protein
MEKECRKREENDFSLAAHERGIADLKEKNCHAKTLFLVCNVRSLSCVTRLHIKRHYISNPHPFLSILYLICIL